MEFVVHVTSIAAVPDALLNSNSRSRKSAPPSFVTSFVTVLLPIVMAILPSPFEALVQYETTTLLTLLNDLFVLAPAPLAPVVICTPFFWLSKVFPSFVLDQLPVASSHDLEVKVYFVFSSPPPSPSAVANTA